MWWRHARLEGSSIDFHKACLPLSIQSFEAPKTAFVSQASQSLPTRAHGNTNTVSTPTPLFRQSYCYRFHGCNGIAHAWSLFFRVPAMQWYIIGSDPSPHSQSIIMKYIIFGFGHWFRGGAMNADPGVSGVGDWGLHQNRQVKISACPGHFCPPFLIGWWEHSWFERVAPVMRPSSLSHSGKLKT